MELKQNLLENYKENKTIETQNEVKNLLINRDNEIFKLYQQGEILQGYKVVSKLPKTIKTEYGDIPLKRRLYVKYDDKKKKYKSLSFRWGIGFKKIPKKWTKFNK
ncbi:hypothetical protein SKUN_00605 [Spiroplasma kunkelii CR2-3x]|uniref:Uncharacterized protein n=1 Tax=Spiroplasma kunkelii CR2-3x TaxID=273035 RepID=A0A0K2JGD8_SPIKU|nr:hypothetical protein [Spiroplasma kunkelii]ALA97498.1 hypothetical protein SKUN_00605 [Spiroplasma kunkelii CR2-3x]